MSDEIDMIVREKNIMFQLSKEKQSHQFIVQLHATFQDDNFLFFLQEYCPGGELYNVMHSSDTNIRLPVDQVAFYTLCIADALEYMHTKCSIAYRDLKPENIMLDTYGYPKLIDMGYAKVLTKMEDDYMTYTFCGTPNYIAPEMIQLSSTHGASFPVDHWALGILVHEMFYGSHPFNTHNNDMDQMELFHSICYDEYNNVAVVAPVNDSTEDDRVAEVIHLISQLLIKDPTQRLGRSILGGDSIGEHPLLKNAYNMDELRKQNTIVAPWIPQLLDTTVSYVAVDVPTINTASTPPPTTVTTTTDWFQQEYPKLSKREQALFDDF